MRRILPQWVLGKIQERNEESDEEVEVSLYHVFARQSRDSVALRTTTAVPTDRYTWKPRSLLTPSDRIMQLHRQG